MNMSGGTDLLIQARSALLDALEALHDHRDNVIVIGAQAIYLHTGAASVALAEMTKDSDLALDARALADEPRIEDAMGAAGFHLDPKADQPGAWISSRGIPVDLMVPDALAGAGGRRGGRIPPHSKKVARRAAGLEAAIIDHAPMKISALAPDDHRTYKANVAGPAALLVAKLHKLGERQTSPDRLVDKDAHDIYRLLTAIPTAKLAETLRHLQRDELAAPATKQGLDFLTNLFAAGPSSVGSMMAGRAEEGVGEPGIVSASATILARDLLSALTPDQV
jgi:hypothetical protein